MFTDWTDKLDTVFSIFVRTRFADWKGEVECYTCPARGHWKEFDCGHWRKRQYLTTRWLADNCRPQCKDCNQYANGRPDTFEAELRDELGDARVEEIIELSHKQFEHNEQWIIDRVTHYKNIVRAFI